MPSSKDGKYLDVLVVDVRLDKDRFTFELSDGRAITAPLAWFPRLLDATPEQRSLWEIGSGVGVHWPEIDEDISVEGLLQGAAAPRWGEHLERRAAEELAAQAA